MKYLIFILECLFFVSGGGIAFANENDHAAIIAHRGASGFAPEHTMLAYDLAEKLGADYFEMDLQMTKDGKLIAMHDDSVTRTTNGDGKVKDLTLCQIKDLNAGATFYKSHPNFQNPTNKISKVPTLNEVLDHFGKRVKFYIEIKKPYEYPGMEDRLLKILKDHQLIGKGSKKGQVIIESFSVHSLKLIHGKYPNLILVQLGDPTQMDLKEIKTYAQGVGPDKNKLTKEFVEEAHKNNLFVNVWTVDDQVELKKLIKWKIDGYFTDYPYLVNKVILESVGPDFGAFSMISAEKGR